MIVNCRGRMAFGSYGNLGLILINQDIALPASFLPAEGQKCRANRQKCRQTDRRTDKKTDRLTDRLTDRQTEGLTKRKTNR